MDIFGGGMGGQQKQPMDPRMAGIVVAVIIIGLLVIMGDTVAFVRPARNVFEQIVVVLPALAFYVFQDRLYADAVAGTIYATIVIFFGFSIMGYLDRHYFKPAQVRKMESDRELEEQLLAREQERRSRQ